VRIIRIYKVTVIISGECVEMDILISLFIITVIVKWKGLIIDYRSP